MFLVVVLGVTYCLWIPPEPGQTRPAAFAENARGFGCILAAFLAVAMSAHVAVSLARWLWHISR